MSASGLHEEGRLVDKPWCPHVTKKMKLPEGIIVSDDGWFTYTHSIEEGWKDDGIDAIEGRSENLSTEEMWVGYASAVPSTLDTLILVLLCSFPSLRLTRRTALESVCTWVLRHWEKVIMYPQFLEPIKKRAGLVPFPDFSSKYEYLSPVVNITVSCHSFGVRNGSKEVPCNNFFGRWWPVGLVPCGKCWGGVSPGVPGVGGSKSSNAKFCEKIWWLLMVGESMFEFPFEKPSDNDSSGLQAEGTWSDGQCCEVWDIRGY